MEFHAAPAGARQEQVDAAQVADQRSDLDLLVGARNGSHEAGCRLMAAHGPSMLRTAWNVLGRYGGNEAEDVVQEAFLAALTTRALPAGDLGAWLRAITARKALDAIRGARRRAEQALSDTPVDPADDPAALVHVIAVREALAKLSPADRAVLVLVDLERFSMEEAASALGSTNVAVRLRAVRARRKLAALLRGIRAPEDRTALQEEPTS